MKISTAFKDAIRKSPQPLYLLATHIGFHPSRMSRILYGEEIKRPHDVRFRLLAERIGFYGPMFDCEIGEAGKA